MRLLMRCVAAGVNSVGSTIDRIHARGNTTHQQSHRMIFSATGARRFLLDVLPYLVVKLPQAELALMMIANTDTSRTACRRKGEHDVDDSLVSMRTHLSRMIMMMNHGKASLI